MSDYIARGKCVMGIPFSLVRHVIQHNVSMDSRPKKYKLKNTRLISQDQPC